MLAESWLSETAVTELNKPHVALREPELLSPQNNNTLFACIFKNSYSLIFIFHIVSFPNMTKHSGYL